MCLWEMCWSHGAQEWILGVLVSHIPSWSCPCAGQQPQGTGPALHSGTRGHGALLWLLFPSNSQQESMGSFLLLLRHRVSPEPCTPLHWIQPGHGDVLPSAASTATGMLLPSRQSICPRTVENFIRLNLTPHTFTCNSKISWTIKADYALIIMQIFLQ